MGSQDRGRSGIQQFNKLVLSGLLIQQKLVQQFTTWAANDDEDTNIANAPREQRKQIYLRSFAGAPHRIQDMLEVFTLTSCGEVSTISRVSPQNQK